MKFAGLPATMPGNGVAVEGSGGVEGVAGSEGVAAEGEALKASEAAQRLVAQAQGLPATQVLETVLNSAERHGYTWPVRYELR